MPSKVPVGLLQYNPEEWADDCFFLSRIAAARSAAHPLGDVPLAPRLQETQDGRPASTTRRADPVRPATTSDVLRRYGHQKHEAATKESATQKVASTPTATKKTSPWNKLASPFVGVFSSGKNKLSGIRATALVGETKVTDAPITAALSKRGRSLARRSGGEAMQLSSPASSQPGASFEASPFQGPNPVRRL
jgi:hypothetical protein